MCFSAPPSIEVSSHTIHLETGSDFPGQGLSPTRLSLARTSAANASPGCCHLCFRATDYRLQVPTTLSSGWINLWEQLIELRKHLLTRLLAYYKRYNLGTARWGMWEPGCIIRALAGLHSPASHEFSNLEAHWMLTLWVLDAWLMKSLAIHGKTLAPF